MRRWPYPALIAHRGGGALAPENTIAGLRVAAALGYRGVEFDVMLTEDGVPVVIHDETWDRTTDGTGRVCETSAAHVARLDAGSRFHRAFAAEPVPTLRAMLEGCLALGLWPNVEIKPASGHDRQTAESTAKVLRECWPKGATPPLISSFSVAALERAAVCAAELPRALLVDALHADWRACAESLGCVAVHAAARAIDAECGDDVRAAGLGLACYTVNDLAEAARLRECGVDALFTDRLDRFLPA